MAALLQSKNDLTAQVTDPPIAHHIAGNDRLSPAEQLEIYRVQFWLRHTASLVEDFPGVGGVLGQQDWQRLVEEYLTSRTPSSWTLRDLGAHLADHIARSSWLPHRALLVDMARLEWAYIEIFDAEEGGRLDAGRLAAVPEAAWQNARIVLNPALRLLSVAYPVADLRRQLRSEDDPVIALPERHPQHLVVYRDQNGALFDKVVGDAEYALLDCLAQGLPLVAACEQAAEQSGQAAASLVTHVGAWFADFARRGWVVDVRYFGSS